MGGASVVNHLIGDSNSLCNSISNFSLDNKQPNSDHCPFLFNEGNNVASRPLTPSSQGKVLCPNPKKANQYALNVQVETYSSLNNHAQAWLHLILCIAQPIFFRKVGGKQCGRLSNTWFDSD